MYMRFLKYLKYAPLLALFLLPAVAAATTAVPWSITNLTDAFIFPNLVNGNPKGIIVAASSTINSTLSVSSLTSGNCVQASTGGLLTTTGAPCPTSSGSSFAYPFPNNSTSTVLTFTNGALFSNLGAGTVNSNSSGGLYNTATSSITNGTGISFTGTPGALIGGSNLTITNSGVTSIIAGTGISVSGATGAVTITNTGSSSAFPFTPTTNYAVLANATGTPIWFQAGLEASTTNNFLAGLTVDSATTNSNINLIGHSTTVGSAVTVTDSNTAGNQYTALVNPSGASNANVNTIPLTATFSVGAGTTGGIVFDTKAAAAPIIFYTGGNSLTANERLRILGSGNVGIGTSNPNALLDVQGTASSTNQVVASLATPAGNFVAADPTGKLIATTTPTFSGVTSVTGTYPIASSGGTTPSITFLGLSTSSPGLTSGQPVYATGNSTIASVASSTFLTSIGGQPAGTYATFGYPFPYNNNTGTTTPILLLASTTIGAGTAITGLTVNGNATTSLQLYVAGAGSTKPVATFGPTSGNQYIQVRQGASGSGYFGLDTAANSGSGAYILQGGLNKSLGFVVNSDTWAGQTQAMTISQTGLVGVGTTSPASPLSVVGSSYFAGAILATSTLTLTPLGTPAGTFLAADPTGKVIATTSPSFSGVSSITQNGGGTAQTGAITFSTTTDSFNGLNFNENITNSGQTFTFSNGVTGTLGIGGGGTGTTTAPSSQLLYGGGSGIYQSVATTTLIAGTNISYSGGTPVIIGSSPITINASGSGSSFGYPFPNQDTNFGNAANATSSVTGFTAGILASSTSHFANADFVNATTSTLGTGDYTTLWRSAPDYLDTQNTGTANPFSEERLLSNLAVIANGAEATRSDVIDCSGTNAFNNINFLDTSYDAYPTAFMAIIADAAAGTCLPKPLVFEVRGPGGNVNQSITQVDLPSGTVGFINNTTGTSSVPSNVKVYVASTTANWPFLVDGALGTTAAPSATPVFAIASSTFVGIGTNFPSQKLEVDNGSLYLNSTGTAFNIISRGATTNFNGFQFDTAGTAEWTFGLRNDSTNNFHFFNENTGSDAMFINNTTNNIGIGTTTPAYPLDIAATTGAQLALSSGAGFSQWSVRNSNGTLYLATTTVAGTATSSVAAFALNGSTGAPTFSELGGSAGCIQATATGLLTNTGTACGTGGGGVTSIQQLGGGTAQTGAVTFSTTTDSYQGLNFGENITNIGAAFTFANNVSGTLAVGGGGTGVSSFTPNQIAYSNSAGTALAFTATSSLFSYNNPVYLNGNVISGIGTCTITVNATAPQSGNNYNTIQAGLNAANVLGGGTVCLTDNTYTITQTLKIGSNITMKGNAYGTVISGNGVTVPTFIQASSTSITNSIIQNLILQNTNILASTTAIAIDGSNMSVTKWDDIEIGGQGFGYGVYLNDTNNQTFYDTFQNLRILNGLNGIYASSTNSVNDDWFNNIRIQNTAATTTIPNESNGFNVGSYCVYLNRSQALNFVNIDCEPTTAPKHTAIRIVSPNVAGINFENLYAEGNATGTEVTSSGASKVSGAISFHGGEITANTVNISDTISNYDNVYLGSGSTLNTNYVPVVLTNNLQAANTTALTVNTGTSFAQSGDLADFVMTNGTDSGIPLHVTNNGTGTSTQISNLGTGPSFEVDDSANDTTPFVIDANGNVGAQTTIPFYPVSISSSTGSQLGLFPSVGAAGWTARAEPSGNLDFATTTAAGNATTTTYAVRFGASGTAGIAVGTTTPWKTIAFVGTGVWAGLDAATSGNVPVCINTTTNQLFVGSLTTTCTPSSERFKMDIASSSIGLAELMEIDPVTFYFKPNAEGTQDTQQNLGFIAEQVETVDPRLVQHQNGLIMGVRQDNLLSVIVKSIQDQQAEIAALKAPAVRIVRSAQDNWQWFAIGLLIVWNLWLTFRRKYEKLS